MTRPWAWKGERQMLSLLIGSSFGPEPEKRKKEIRADRQKYAETVIAKKLDLTSADVVLDLGSGCGFMAAPIARKAARLYCADVSPDFAGYCSEETKSLTNVSVLVIPYANLEQLVGLGINKAFAHAVFIHFSLFDSVLYFRELRKVLPAGGLLLIDINDIDRIDTSSNEGFNKHLEYYRSDRGRLFDLMQWHSVPAFLRVAAAEGFEMMECNPSKSGAFTQLLLRRSA